MSTKIPAVILLRSHNSQTMITTIGRTSLDSKKATCLLTTLPHQHSDSTNWSWDGPSKGFWRCRCSLPIHWNKVCFHGTESFCNSSFNWSKTWQPSVDGSPRQKSSTKDGRRSKVSFSFCWSIEQRESRDWFSCNKFTRAYWWTSRPRDESFAVKLSRTWWTNSQVLTVAWFATQYSKGTFWIKLTQYFSLCRTNWTLRTHVFLYQPKLRSVR